MTRRLLCPALAAWALASTLEAGAQPVGVFVTMASADQAQLIVTLTAVRNAAPSASTLPIDLGTARKRREADAAHAHSWCGTTRARPD